MDEGICSASEYGALSQGVQEVFPSVKFRHLDIGVAYRSNSVGITTGAPRDAILLNTNQPVVWETVLSPQDYREKQPYLRLINLPVNELCNTVLVIKLEFDRSPDELVL